MKTYDFVIVGAGTAGCVLAYRLAQHPNSRVLVLEAGGKDSKREIKIPAAFSKLFKSDVDWAFFTEPESELNGRQLYWPRGKTLGGCSSINAMIYIRGHRQDYDDWRDAGLAGWGYDDLLPLFKASEANSRGASQWHGADGPLAVSDQLCPNELSLKFVEACGEAGIRSNVDFNGPEQEGAGLYQVNQRKGQRCSAADAFLKPAMLTGRVDVETGAHVTRIRMERGCAIAVDYYKEGVRKTVAPHHEVILAAGAIQSPQILMLSGIGPADHLREHGIDVVLDVQDVGANLQDHLACGVMYHCSRNCTLDSAETLANIARYATGKSGPLTSNVAEGGAFVRSGDAVAIPDLQLFFGTAFFVRHGFVRPKGPGFSFGVVLLRPESRGTIRLNSADPNTPARIRANYLTRGSDRDIMLAGLKLARQIANASAFSVYRGAEYLPGESAKDDSALLAHLREWSETMYHPVGTCRMGTDAGAVVDPQLRVRGVKGLRVVDASVMPTLIGGNTNAPTMVIAEKAATMMIERGDGAAAAERR